MTRIRPSATIEQTVNGHTLRAEKYPSGWVVVCPAWPDLERTYAGVDDLCPCLDAFEARATAGGAAVAPGAPPAAA